MSSAWFRIQFGTLLLTLLCHGGAWGQTKASPKFEITGTLVSRADGSPIPRGHLTPSLVGRGRAAGRQFPTPAGTYETDEHGHFSITLPSAGAWQVSAGARGYTTQTYEEHGQFSSAVVLTNDAPSIDLRFQLSPEADITGFVLDEAGEAVRRAQVSLLTVEPAGPDHAQPVTAMRTATQTDDRGAYEFAGLPPGSYRISVRAQPWYAVAGQTRRPNTGDASPINPSLDVVYPITWFPGVSDPALAETLTLRAGDTSQADFHLLPVPSIHLRIVPPLNVTANGRALQAIPTAQMVGPGAGNQPFVDISFQRNEQGQIDIGGLAPGLYQVRLGGFGQGTQSSVVRVSDGQIQTVDMNATTTEARVTVHLDGAREADAGSIQVNLLDPETRSGVAASVGPGGNFRGTRNRQTEAGADRILEVPPGRYEVVLQGRADVYLTGISAKGAEAAGRLVSVPPGDSTLTLHVAEGRVTVRGFVSLQGQPTVGAMVLLVPTTVGDPASITILRRDQSNTDGSFDIPDVIPGQYILIAIDNGWEINWSDASTLRRYLTQGVPLDLTAGGNVKQNIVAQAP